VTADINILVVDDLEPNLVAAEALLARPGIRIIKAACGQDALEALLQHDIALALIDVQMPHMDGFELAELIRSSERTRAVPLIFLTAAARDAKTVFRGYEAGAVDFLYKPVDTAALRSKVNVFVELRVKEAELARQLDELRQALHLNEMFTAVLGHDLRGPLAVIMSGADVMMTASDNPKLASVAGRIKSSTLRMAKMVDQLLDIARIRSGGIELQLQKTDYAALCRASVDELAGVAQIARIAIEVQGDVNGIVDPDRLFQVISNLVGNALQHGKADGAIQIGIDGRGREEIGIRISNPGRIPERLMANLFQPFHAERQGGRSGSQGLGLGLYIVKSFVDAHGGRVMVDSGANDETVFRVILPRRATSQFSIR
jgi:signal transduction histidine kinase